MALFINGVGQDTFSMNGVAIDNLYVDGVLVWSLATDVAPIYELTEPLVNDGSFDYLDNSATSGSQFDAKLLTSGDTAWNPTAQEYPGDETAVIDFGTNKADTQWTPPQDEEYTFTFVTDVDNGSYSMVSINPKGDGLTADVLYDGVLESRDTGLDYIPPTESVKLTENMSQTIVPKNPLCVITMSQYAFGIGDTATVTFTWDTIVSGFLTNQIVVNNGSLSTIVQDTYSPWIWTATFTPDADVADDTNIISIGSINPIDDNWGNTTINTTTSPNYTVNTVAVDWVSYINFDDSSTVISEFSVNTITQVDYSDIPSVFVDSDGNDVPGISMTYSETPTENIEFADGNTTYGTCMGSGGLAANSTYNNGTSVAFHMVLPVGNYNISTLHSRDSSSTTKRTSVFISGYGQQDIDVSNNNTGSHCLAWTSIVSDGIASIDIYVEPQSTYDGSAYMNAIKISKIGGTA